MQSKVAIDEALKLVREAPTQQLLDRFENYHFAAGQSAEKYLRIRTESLLINATDETTFFFNGRGDDLVLISSHENEWDREHFGFKMASLELIASPGNIQKKQTISDVLNECIAHLRDKGVKYVSARVGDRLAALHTFEDVGFRYFETIIWALTSIQQTDPATRVRLMRPEEEDVVASLAERSQYRRGHLYCDDGFDPAVVDSMYGRWVRTSVAKGDPIAILERDDKIAGFFAFTIDDELSQNSGWRYAHLRLLALDSQFRGRGIGREIFQGTLSLLRGLGIDYVDTGYASRNYISARLHVQTNFMPVYDEVTFHLWLG